MEPSVWYFLGQWSLIHLYPQPNFILYSEAESHLEASRGLGAHVLAAAWMMRLDHKARPFFKRTFFMQRCPTENVWKQAWRHHWDGFSLWLCTLTQSWVWVLLLRGEVVPTELKNNNRKTAPKMGLKWSPWCQICLNSPLFQTEKYTNQSNYNDSSYIWIYDVALCDLYGYWPSLKYKRIYFFSQ